MEQSFHEGLKEGEVGDDDTRQNLREEGWIFFLPFLFFIRKLFLGQIIKYKATFIKNCKHNKIYI